jgi:hypothetical protein
MKGVRYDILIFIDWCLLGWFTWCGGYERPIKNFPKIPVFLLTTGTVYGIM